MTQARGHMQPPKQRFLICASHKERVLSTPSSAFCKQRHSERFHVFTPCRVRIPSYNVHFSSDNIQSFQQNCMERLRNHKISLKHQVRQFTVVSFKCLNPHCRACRLVNVFGTPRQCRHACSQSNLPRHRC